MTGVASSQCGDILGMGHPATPKDATKATDEQRELPEQLEHQDDRTDDPDKRGQPVRRLPVG